jgi:hypothetical protein
LTIAGSLAVNKKNPVKIKSLKPLLNWLEALYARSLVPRDGFWFVLSAGVRESTFCAQIATVLSILVRG